MKQKETVTESRTNLLIKMFAIVFLLWGVSAIVIYYLLDNWTDRGTIGDMFGAVNALFSGLALAGLLYTIFLQRDEIKMNRKEIDLNRKELKKSAEVQQKANKAMHEQSVQTHLTAQINAMSTVISYYNAQIENQANSPELIERAKQKRKMLIQQINDLIDGLQNSDID